ncbi:MAG: hypothetical protein HYX77_08740 [Acidobacteria bacterium]|nr:hypothetical protein [Acidobacteriota bacterium]
MSFIDSAAEVLDRTEASLNSLITDALKAKAYREIATIAAMAESVAAIGPGRSREKASKVSTAAEFGGGTQATAETAKTPEPSWMRPKTT